MAINDRGVTEVSITLNESIESIVLFGHDVNFRSDDTFNLILLLTFFNFFVSFFFFFFFSNVEFKRLHHSFMSLNTISKLLSKYINIIHLYVLQYSLNQLAFLERSGGTIEFFF